MEEAIKSFMENELTVESIKNLFIMLKNKAKEMNKLEEVVYCDKCGAEMIKRKSKFNDGYWWGCSQFPRCRKTLKDV